MDTNTPTLSWSGANQKRWTLLGGDEVPTKLIIEHLIKQQMTIELSKTCQPLNAILSY